MKELHARHAATANYIYAMSEAMRHPLDGNLNRGTSTLYIEHIGH